MGRLSNIGILSGLEPAALERIESLGVARHVPKDVLLIHEGEVSDSFFFLVEGQVRVYVTGSEGKDLVVNHLHAGDYFGELAVLGSQARSASVMSLTPCLVHIFSRRTFTILINEHPLVAHRLLANMGRRVEELTDRVKSLALDDVYQRICKLFDELAERSPDEEALLVRERLTQQDIANRIGASREMVARVLKELTIGGYIQIHNKQVRIRQSLPARF